MLNGGFPSFTGKLGECYDRPMLRDHSQHGAPSFDHETGGSYTRKEVCRLLKIEPRQLKSWERQQLIPELVQYRFSDLLALKQIARLRAENAHPRVIKQALQALRQWMADSPGLSEDVRVYKEGRRVRVQIGKQKLEPGSGQLLFDFAEEEIKKLLHLPASQKSGAAMAERLRNKIEADRWFERGLELEQTGAPYEQIIEAYTNASQLDPQSAGALVNLGTVFFNGHAWADAETQYKKALEIDPNYALAHFNLGNLYDERGDCSNALEHYREALRLHPGYEDVHYNLALLYQGMQDVMGAVRHWRAFLKLDSRSTWAQIARRELAKLEAKTVVPGSKPSSNRVHVIKSEKV
jgi:tetratricopeptide (TPR) repeat protein